MKSTVLLLIIALCFNSAWADCGDRERAAADAYQRRLQYEAKKAEINAEIPQLEQTIARAESMLRGYETSLKICALSDLKNKKDAEALGSAIEALNHFTIFEKTLGVRLFTIVENGNEASDWSLSAALRNYAEKEDLNSDQRFDILAMAKAFDLLSETDKAWKHEERVWLEAIKSDTRPIQILIPRLRALYEEKTGADGALDQSCRQMAEQVDVLKHEMNKADIRRAMIFFENSDLNGAINDANATIRANPGCPTHGTFDHSGTR